MTGPLGLGAGFGAGVALLVAWVLPARPTLAQVFAALHPAVPTATPMPPLLAPEPGGWIAGLGRPAVPLLARLGLPRSATIGDLAICGRDPARHLAEQAAMAVLGFLAVPAVAGMLTLGGLTIGWQTPLWAALAGAVIGAFAPDLALASQATKRRRELRDAVAGMLDLVVISLAGGAGVEQALRDATDEPTDWAQRALRKAVEAAHLTRRPLWQTIGALGDTTGVSTLSELAAALSLAGTEGARIKATLSARSAALSAHQLAEAESAATSATERMVLPVVGLLGGFLIFIGYPAFATVLQAL
jgi:Flp pilus assembly protein TadB